jgi:beta-lactamase superfamily II metal-dependent hydrolase
MNQADSRQSKSRSHRPLSVLFRHALCLACLLPAMWASAKSKSLQIYFVDVEGGQATLFVTPSGQSLLVDTGWPGFDGRDADRIVAAAKKAGIAKIDYVLITHFHMDHGGGATQLATKIPVGAFIDHGDNRESTDAPTTQVWQDYQKLLSSGKYKRILAKPGDKLPIRGMNATIVSSDGAVIAKPLAGAGADNPECKTAEKYPADQTENGRSLGAVITFGKLRILDLGDLTHDKELDLMCPANKLGKIDIYIVSHHGWMQSGSPALVTDTRALLNGKGFVEGNHGEPAQFVVEKAFAER